jgi:uncharacterized protein involved in cysteine biosynthesis
MVNLDWTAVAGMPQWVELLLVVVVIVNLLMSTALVVFFLAPVTTKKGSTWQSAPRPENFETQDLASQ